MKKLICNILLPVVLSLCLNGCNHEVFVKPLTVEPQAGSIDWTGGEVSFNANQPITFVDITAFRWVNGYGMPLGNRGMQFSLHGDGSKETIANDLCHIDMQLARGGELTIKSGYNLYADTVYLNLDLYVINENVKRGMRILPNPGFGHGEITYDLTMWSEYESVDTILLAQIAGGGDEPFDYTLKKKGDIVARRAGQFKPFDKELSDNIFGREEFTVDGVTLRDNGSWQEPQLSNEKIPYTSAVQHVDDNPLRYTEDVVVRLKPDEWYKVKAIVKGRHLGVDYSLEAISPAEGLADRTIKGVYWISTPTSYTIEIELGVK